ncbi:MAG TPA: hypothetical protein VGP47_02255 [Parachlamydiaceae bacterium]|nr:hypothetical protein [Parachlamydiaceae bacterium]
MKQERPFSRYNLFWLMVLCYLLPLLAISAYGAFFPRASTDWNILGLGFLLTAMGSLVFFWLMTSWEESLQAGSRSISPNHEQDVDPYHFAEAGQVIDPAEYDLAKRSLAEAQQTQIRLLDEIDILTEEIQKVSFVRQETLQHADKIQAELEHTKRAARQQLEMQQNQIRELQEAIANQKAISEKKQQQTMQLENKVGGLTYEIKTLLKFAEAHSGPSLSHDLAESSSQEVQTFSEKTDTYFEPQPSFENFTQSPHEASLQLKHCLDIAQKIKGSQRFGSQIYSFMDSPADSFSLDLRRLCDRLRSETQSVILLYSPKDNQLLFASNQIKTLTGWSPEKFVQNFSELLVDESEWKQGVGSLAMRSEAEIKLHLRTRSVPNLCVNANLGMIPTGIFRNHTIAVLYPTS